MPKATRKKKLKQQDFKKAKLKVGKKKPAANTDVDVSFRTQAISIPSQSILDDKPAAEAVNSRNKSYQELIVQLRHYSAQSRKDAMVGLRDLHNKHPETIISQLSTLFEGIAKLLVDDDSGVRKLTLSFLKDFTPAVTQDQFRPFMSLMMAFTCSGMTHISEDIRLDGLRFLGIWRKQYPALVVHHIDKVIPNFISLLITNGKAQGSLTGTGSALLVNPRSQLGGAKTRFEVLESLHEFLQLVLSNDDSLWWFMGNTGVPSGYLDADRRKDLRASIRVADANTVPGRIHAELMHKSDAQIGTKLFDFFGAGGTIKHDESRVAVGLTNANGKNVAIQNSYDLKERTHLKAFVDTFMPILVDFWLESSPSVFSAGSIVMSPALSVMHMVLKMVNLLWRSLLTQDKVALQSSWLEGWMKSIAKHFTVLFPFGQGSFSSQDQQVDEILLNMNILFCEILSHLQYASEHINSDLFSQWHQLVYGFSLQTMKGNTSDRNASILSVRQIEAMYPVVWELLKHGDAASSVKLLQGLISMYDDANGSSTARALFRFLAKLLLIEKHPQYTGKFSTRASTEMNALFANWLTTLPKKLWQLRSNDQAFSKDILDLLVHVLRSDTCDIGSSNVSESLKASLAPFFYVQTTKGPVYGPFSIVDESVQMAAVTLLYYLPEWPDRLTAGTQI
ncbi:hypothetical protein DFS34DRAFT_57494 [Phlyctochytrium arcticum]|nr:hypothetical protein DFS34DRAFT_57494 [Phlyctochytrium arcticum]